MRILGWQTLTTGLALMGTFSSGIADDVEFAVEYTGDLLANVAGGTQTGARRLDNLDLRLTVGGGSSRGVGTLHVHGLYNNGATFSDELVGDLQVTSNIDAGEAWRIFEFWYEFGADDWSLRSGLYDLNSEFDVNEAGSFFLNSSHGIGAELSQTGKNGPGIFPVSSLSLRAAYQFESFTVRAAILDAVPGDPDDAASNSIRLDRDDGYLAIAELDVPIKDSGRLWTGYWEYSAKFEQMFIDGPHLHNHGWYAGAEKRFSIGSLSAAGFVRYGRADERLNAIADYTGLGISIEGPFAARPDDQLGLAMASARAGNTYRSYLMQLGDDPGQRETTWELTYLARFSDHLVVQPNVQFVQDPSITGRLDDAWVIGLRIKLGT